MLLIVLTLILVPQVESSKSFSMLQTIRQNANSQALSSPGDAVVLTSFGPFNQINRNPSESVMQAVQDLNSAAGDPLNLVCHSMPVSYSDVEHNVQLLWRIQPKLMVHLGVGYNGTIDLETEASSAGYVTPDIYGKVPPNNRCMIVRTTALDVEKLVKNSDPSIVHSSNKAGSLFIHVPGDLDVHIIAAIVFAVLQDAARMVDQNNSQCIDF